MSETVCDNMLPTEIVCRDPKTYQEVVVMLQKKCGIMLPGNDDDEACPRTGVDIRREMVAAERQEKSVLILQNF